MEDKETLKVAKLEKINLVQRMLLEPHVLRGKLPSNKVPFLSDSGIVIETEVVPPKPARINDRGQLLSSIEYKCTQLAVLNKYVQVEGVLDFEDSWIGTLFGFSVSGTGGEGETRGAKIVRIEGETFVAEGFSQQDNPAWKKIKNLVEKTIEKQQVTQA